MGCLCVFSFILSLTMGSFGLPRIYVVLHPLGVRDCMERQVHGIRKLPSNELYQESGVPCWSVSQSDSFLLGSPSRASYASEFLEPPL